MSASGDAQVVNVDDQLGSTTGISDRSVGNSWELFIKCDDWSYKDATGEELGVVADVWQKMLC